MTRSCIVLVALLALAPTAHSQSAASPADTSRRWTVGSVNVRAGGSQLGLAELNSSLARGGHPTFANQLVMYGLSGSVRFGRASVGVTGESSLPVNRTTESWLTRLSAGGATIDAAFALIDARGLVLSPMASVGVRRTSLHFERRGDFTYDQGLEDPSRGVDLSSRGAIAQYGASAEAHVRTRLTGMLSLSVQAGTTRPFGSMITYAGDNRVTGEPSRATGSFFRIGLGKPLGKRREIMSSASAALLSVIGH